MTGSCSVTTSLGKYLLIVSGIVLLQSCADTSLHPANTAISNSQPLSGPVPVLLNVPAARVVRKGAVSDPMIDEAESSVVQPAWIFTSAQDGSLPQGAILPPGIFTSLSIKSDAQARASSKEFVAETRLPEVRLSDYREARQVIASVHPTAPLHALIYASPTSRDFYATLGVDYQQNIAVWQDFMARHEINFEVVTDIDVLMYHRSPSVLLLPSAVALNDEERAAIQTYRKRGGAVLATWLSGVRGPLGEWTGFGFMEDVLNTGVAGDTSQDGDDVYINPYGDNPVTHRLPAGLRVWTARTEGWYPLRLVGVNSAASIMDWSRNVRAGKSNSVISYNERVQANGLSSRAVVLGYPERTWQAADPTAMDAIAMDALNWVARRPAAYLGAWPKHHRSAMLLALDASNGMSANEARYAKQAESISGHISYFVLTQQLADAHAQLAGLQAHGHEVGFLGDRFESYAGQSESEQRRRIDLMLEEMKVDALPGSHQGFHAPMEAYDPTTIKVLAATGMRYMIGDPSASEDRLPTYIKTGDMQGILILPRTQNGPDDVLSEGHDYQDFLAELSLSERMSGLSVVRIPSASVMNDKQWAQFDAALRVHEKSMWVASGKEIADWWETRSQVSVTLDDTVTPALLTVDVQGQQVLPQPVTVMVNLPSLHARLSVLPDDGERIVPAVVRRDVWRADIILDALTPGRHHWFLRFDDVDK